jgi:hypothetical protein
MNGSGKCKVLCCNTGCPCRVLCFHACWRCASTLAHLAKCCAYVLALNALCKSKSHVDRSTPSLCYQPHLKPLRSWSLRLSPRTMALPGGPRGERPRPIRRKLSKLGVKDDPGADRSQDRHEPQGQKDNLQASRLSNSQDWILHTSDPYLGILHNTDPYLGILHNTDQYLLKCEESLGMGLKCKESLGMGVQGKNPCERVCDTQHTHL